MLSLMVVATAELFEGLARCSQAQAERFFSSMIEGCPDEGVAELSKMPTIITRRRKKNPFNESGTLARLASPRVCTGHIDLGVHGDEQPDVIAVAAKHFPGSRIDLERRREGRRNIVYVVLVDGQRYAFRIAKGHNSRFLTDLYVAKRARRWGIAAPEVIASQTNSAVLGFRYTVTSAYQGEHPKPDPTLYREQVGPGLSKFHDVRTEGFGRLGPDGRGRFATWQAFLSRTFTRNATKLSDEKILADKELARMEEIHRNMLARVDVRGGVLLMNDVSRRNIFVKKSSPERDEPDQLEGFIDFELVASGDPARDFDRLRYDEGIDCRPKGMAERTPYDYRLLLAMVGLGVAGGDTEEMQRHRSKLEAILHEHRDV